MNNQLTTFSFHNKPIRVMEIYGNPWFVSVDVCRALSIHLDSQGYVNTTNALRKLAPDEMTFHPIEGQRGLPVKCVSESGLYKLVMRSDKPEARTFQDWVTREVLPSIRKTGAYVTGQPSLQDNPSMDPLDLIRFPLVGVVEINGNPWFVAADIAKVLGLKNITTTLHAGYFDSSERAKSDLGGTLVNVISESGLYKLVMRSDKPQAKAFQDWVTREVLLVTPTNTTRWTLLRC